MLQRLANKWAGRSVFRDGVDAWAAIPLLVEVLREARTDGPVARWDDGVEGLRLLVRSGWIPDEVVGDGLHHTEALALVSDHAGRLDDFRHQLVDALNEVAPRGTRFGPHPADQHDYGFWNARCQKCSWTLAGAVPHDHICDDCGHERTDHLSNKLCMACEHGDWWRPPHSYSPCEHSRADADCGACAWDGFWPFPHAEMCAVCRHGGDEHLNGGGCDLCLGRGQDDGHIFQGCEAAQRAATA